MINYHKMEKQQKNEVKGTNIIDRDYNLQTNDKHDIPYNLQNWYVGSNYTYIYIFGH